MNTHDKCGLLIKSAITGGKYEELRFRHPSMHPIFWFPHHLSHRIRPGQVDVTVAFVVIVVVVVVVAIVIVVVVQ